MPHRRSASLALAAALLIVAGLAIGAACVNVAADDRRTAFRRADLLHRGVNLSGWSAQAPPDPAHFQSAITADDVQRIRRMGFDHVRLPVDPAVLAPSGAWDAAGLDVLYYLEDAVRMIEDGGLNVIVNRLLLTPDTAGEFEGHQAAAAAISRENGEKRVLARGMPMSHSPSRRAFKPTAVSTWPRWVRGRPM